MPRGDKSAYTDKQKRQAEHIEAGYEKCGLSEGESARRAWATVNAMTHGGKKSGAGRGKPEDHAPARKGGRLGGSSTKRTAASRSAAGKKAAATRKRHASAAAKKTTARKTTARKTTARKTTARKTTARKTTARKTTARKTTAR